MIVIGENNNVGIRELRKNTFTMLMGALTLVASLSWLKAIQVALDHYMPESIGNYRITGYFIAALVITVISVLLTSYLKPYTQDKKKTTLHNYTIKEKHNIDSQSLNI